MIVLKEYDFLESSLVAQKYFWDTIQKHDDKLSTFC